MRRRVTTADYYRYYRIPSHLSRSIPFRIVPRHSVGITFRARARARALSPSVISRAIEIARAG